MCLNSKEFPEEPINLDPIHVIALYAKPVSGYVFELHKGAQTSREHYMTERDLLPVI